MQPIIIAYKGYTITTDKSLMDVHAVHQWLTTKAYWCEGIPFETVQTAFDNSFCIGVLLEGKQVGYARLITDYAVFGYLADVYVEEQHRGKGISKKMMAVIFELDWVNGLRGVKLATRDAHGLYEQFGFTVCSNPGRIMEINRPNIYQEQITL